jgi:hypothetical protein
MARSNEYFVGQRSVSRWLVNLPNRRTRTQYIAALTRYTGYTDRTPDELVSTGLENAEDAHDDLKMFYNSLELASKTKMRIYQSIRSFYRANGITLGRKPITFRASVEYEPTKLYTQDEVAMLVDAAGDVRDKAVITFLDQSARAVDLRCTPLRPLINELTLTALEVLSLLPLSQVFTQYCCSSAYYTLHREVLYSELYYSRPLILELCDRILDLLWSHSEHIFLHLFSILLVLSHWKYTETAVRKEFFRLAGARADRFTAIHDEITEWQKKGSQTK